MKLSIDKPGDAPSFFQAGSVIYKNGSSPKFLYIIKRGEVRLMKVVNNHLHIYQICVAGDIINDISVLTKKSVDHSAVASSDVEVVAIEAKDVRSVIENCPKWIPDIFDTLCERLLDSQEIIHSHNLQSGPIDQKYILSKEEEKILMKRIEDFKPN